MQFRLSKKARNKHEELKKDIFVPKGGYIEAFVVNETSENVWYDISLSRVQGLS
jgi:hypothetical protein